jgi:hypothetical protein
VPLWYEFKKCCRFRNRAVAFAAIYEQPFTLAQFCELPVLFQRVKISCPTFCAFQRSSTYLAERFDHHHGYPTISETSALFSVIITCLVHNCTSNYPLYGIWLTLVPSSALCITCADTCQKVNCLVNTRLTDWGTLQSMRRNCWTKLRLQVTAT